MPNADKDGSARQDRDVHESPKDPKWANSLKKLYDSVVDEPLPDNFKDLLSKLDDGKA